MKLKDQNLVVYICTKIFEYQTDNIKLSSSFKVKNLLANHFKNTKLLAKFQFELYKYKDVKISLIYHASEHLHILQLR